MHRILVIGGNGFYGRTVAGALRKIDGLDVSIGSRSSAARMDLRDTSTFDTLDGYDVVVNCTDSLAANATAATAHVLARGGTFVETTDDAETLLKLIQTWRGQPTTGRLLIGLGLMPGLTNIVAAELSRRVGGARTLEVAVRFNPLSGAGPGMSGLSAKVIANVGRRFIDGALRNSPPVWTAPLIPFRDGFGTAVRTGLPEALMLGFSTGARDTAAYLSTGSPLIESALFGAALAFPQDALFKPLATDALSQAITTLRGGVLRDRRTPFEVVALADRASALRHDGSWLRVTMSDGMRAAGALTAAGIAALCARPVASGVYLPDELFSLDDALHALRGVGGLQVEVTESLTARQHAAA